MKNKFFILDEFKGITLLTSNIAGILLYTKVKQSELGRDCLWGTYSLLSLCPLFNPGCWSPSYMMIPRCSQPG